MVSKVRSQSDAARQVLALVVGGIRRHETRDPVMIRRDRRPRLVRAGGIVPNRPGEHPGASALPAPNWHNLTLHPPAHVLEVRPYIVPDVCSKRYHQLTLAAEIQQPALILQVRPMRSGGQEVGLTDSHVDFRPSLVLCRLSSAYTGTRPPSPTCCCRGCDPSGPSPHLRRARSSLESHLGGRVTRLHVTLAADDLGDSSGRAPLPPPPQSSPHPPPPSHTQALSLPPYRLLRGYYEAISKTKDC
jgi:hypothetical protein